MHRPLRLRDRLLLLASFGGAIAYCAYGAIVGDLYIPSRHRHGGVHLSGIDAWIFTLSPVLMLVAILIREREIGQFQDRTRTAVELTLLFVGLGLLFIPQGARTNCASKITPSEDARSAGTGGGDDQSRCSQATSSASTPG